MSRIMPATGGLGLLLMMMIVTAATVMIMLVLFFMRTLSMIVRRMIVTATFVMLMAIILVVPVIMVAAVVLFGTDGGEIEKPQHPQANAGHQNHGTEYPVCRQISCEPSTGIEVEKHRAPEDEQEHAQKMNADTGCFHGDILF